jgi:hypothetical protein
MAEAWSDKLGSNPVGLRQALAAVAPCSLHTIVLMQPPIAPSNASREAIRGGARPPFFEGAKDRSARLSALDTATAAADGKAQILDVADALLRPDGSIRIIAGGRLTYKDSHHLTDSGTALVRERLDSALSRALALR